MERRLAITAGVLAWGEVAETMATSGFPLQMRMIDGEPAFPDETPPESWNELRVAHQGTMVTIRRNGTEIVLVVWGNADAEQLRLQEKLAAAFTRSSSIDPRS